jgi:hypothetical protein
MSYHGKTELHIFEENLNKELYVYILEARLPVDIPRIFGNGDWLFQQDGDPKHTSKLAQEWLQDNVPAFIPKDEWPANSPDLNPIENLWAILQRRVYEREPRTMVALRRFLKEEWAAKEVEKLQNLVNSMPRRFAEVTEKHGASTHY